MTEQTSLRPGGWTWAVITLGVRRLDSTSVVERKLPHWKASTFTLPLWGCILRPWQVRFLDILCLSSFLPSFLIPSWKMLNLNRHAGKKKKKSNCYFSITLQSDGMGKRRCLIQKFQRRQTVMCPEVACPPWTPLRTSVFFLKLYLKFSNWQGVWLSLQKHCPG